MKPTDHLYELSKPQTFQVFSLWARHGPRASYCKATVVDYVYIDGLSRVLFTFSTLDLDLVYLSFRLTFGGIQILKNKYYYFLFMGPNLLQTTYFIRSGRNCWNNCTVAFL